MSVVADKPAPAITPTQPALPSPEREISEFAPAIPLAMTSHQAPGQNPSDHDHRVDGTQVACVVVGELDPGHVHVDTQDRDARVDLAPRHIRPDAHVAGAGGDLDGGQDPCDALGTAASVDLQMAAAFLDDIERTRIAAENRLRAMRDDHGLEGAPAYSAFAAIEDTFQKAEHDATLQLKRALRRHPLGQWVKQTVGVGEKQGARLLAAVVDPLWNDAEQRPRRGPAEFWQYCGHGDPERSRLRRGQKAQFNPEAKMRAHLVAESCMKCRQSPYRAVYDAARASWADRETSDGHKHNHALRLVAKAVLKDMYLAARAAR